MTTPSSTESIWESGRLVAATPARRSTSGFTREQWIAATLLVLCAVVLTFYVTLLERVVSRNALQHDEQRARAVAEAGCESSQPAEARGACRAILDGRDAVASAADRSDADAAPANDLYAGAGRMATASLGSTAAIAGVAGMAGTSQ